MTGPTGRENRDLFFWLALRLTPGVGPTRFSQLLRHFHSPEAVFRAPARTVANSISLPPETIAALTRFDWEHIVEEELERIQRLGYKLLTLNDSEYPPRLKKIWNPPPVLWISGEILPADHAAVAIVGSRSATEYGRRTSSRLAAELAGSGINVVSGLALGIDSAAHRGALAAGGRTTGILGCGLNVVYPKINGDLYEEIPRAGAVISEFPLDTTPERWHFPMRNRIIAGLSLAVVVVEAGERSGALITAKLALEENRDVMAVPGRAGSTQNRGAHALLRQGAQLVESGQDIIDVIAPQLERLPPGKNGRSAEKPPAPPDMSDRERDIWESLGDETVHIDALGRQVGLTPHQLAPVLLEMELKGLVKQLPGMRYIKG